MSLPVSATLRSRWRSRKHVGPAAPVVYVELAGGHFYRRYDTWSGARVAAFIKGHTGRPWQAFWTRASPWRELPGIVSVELDQGFDNNGLATCTIQAENLLYKGTTGVAGVFQKIKRGWYSPYRGGKYPSPPKDPYGESVEQNPWWQYLNANPQVKVWMGYGADALVPVFTGLVDEIDMTSTPDRMTLVARDFGQVLVDQKLFGNVKDKSLRDPVVFADRRKSDKTERVGSAPSASSSEPGYPARFVLDKTQNTYWASRARSTPDDTEWVKVHVPEGRYEDFFLWAQYEGMECYVSIFARKVNHTAYQSTKGDDRPSINNRPQDYGWIDTGQGTVPGSDGGMPYVQKITTVARGRTYRLPFVLKTGDNTAIQLAFRKLGRSRINQNNYPGRPIYRAAVRGFRPIKRTTLPEARQSKYVLVDDLADVVKVCLRWAGFQEWDIEDCGISLSSPMIVNRQDSLMDVIKKMADLIGFIFFMAEPTDEDLSMGVPTWRRSGLWAGFGSIEEITDRDLLTGIKIHYSDEPLASIIRVAGKMAKKADGGIALGGGVQPGSIEPRRIVAEYRPPWARGTRSATDVDAPIDRTAGIIKHTIHYENQYRSEYECKTAAVFIAAQQALASITGVIECPGYPGFQLDDAVKITDTATGTNQRLYVVQRSVTFDAGRDTKWIETLQGSLLDTPDVRNLLRDYYAVVGAELAEEQDKRKATNTRTQAPTHKRAPLGRKGK